MIKDKLAKEILNILLKSGANFSDIFIQKKMSNSLRLEDRKIENSSSGYELGCGMRLLSENSTYYAFVDSLESEKLLGAAKVLSSAVKSSGKKSIINLMESPGTYKSIIKKSPSEFIPENKKDILLSVDKNSRDFSDCIIQVSSSLSDLEEEIYTANSLENFSYQKIVRVFLNVNVIAVKNNEMRTGYKSLARTEGFEVFDIEKPEKIAAEASRMAVIMLEAVDAPTGLLPVVIGPAFGGVIFHEACGHGLEADAIFKDASVFKGMIGKKIANEIVTAIDDSTIENRWGSYKYDGEGFPSQKTVLIRDGVLESYIYDYRTAEKLKSIQSGNGRRQSFRHIPIPRMSNTFIDTGEDDPKSIIGSVSRGIYAKEFAGGQVDPATGDFVFGISEGYLIENGTIGTPIKGATLIGNGPEVLKKIEAVGNDLDFAPGFCGKGGQSISNEVGQPTIKISEITVGGTGVSGAK